MTNAYELSGYSDDSHTEASDPGTPDEFVLVVGQDGIPTRAKQVPPEYPLSLELHPIQNGESLLVSIYPPREPVKQTKHVPCDIVLVIDVSASMISPAPLPDVQPGGEQEVSGLSILDLTKHAARTILETLDERDRLAIVTFSHGAKIVQTLTPMTPEAKKVTDEKIEKLEDESSTNLWAGIKTGLQVIEQSSFTGNVQGIYVLTDGMPNHMCPEQGYVRKLAPMLKEMAESRPCVPTIHTFGFGYHIMSNLLQSIAEVGNGNYAFIPDAGMIGTVFVHAVANLYSTYATSATLTITGPRNSLITSRSGIIAESAELGRLTLKLGNIQFGQSRDNIVHFKLPNARSQVTATLTYQLPSGVTHTVDASVHTFHDTGLPQSIKDYHKHRDRLCNYLSRLFPLAPNGEHVKHPKAPETGSTDIEALLQAMRTSTSDPTDPNIQSLMHDLKQSSADSQDGQISHALSDNPQNSYWMKWGRHYLPSLLHAHLRQQCNSFKDPGPMRYGVHSPLFNDCRDQLDRAFDNLPAPKPSLTGNNLRRANSSAYSAGGKVMSNVKMSRYNSASNPCFLGSCMVKMVDDGASTNGKRDRELRVQDLRTGMYVLNLLTGEARKIVAVVKTPARSDSQQQICRVGDGLWITPYHPIFHRPSQKWVFPIDVANEVRDLQSDEAVYSILLSPSKSASSHAIEISGVSCVTLGHGIVDITSRSAHGSDDARIHAYFGNYEAVSRDLVDLPQDSQGVHLCAGTSRNDETGLVDGFIADLSSSTWSTASTVIVEHPNTITALPLTASKQGFDFSTNGIDPGHCSPVTMSFPSSPSPDDRVWWQSRTVGIAA